MWWWPILTWFTELILSTSDIFTLSTASSSSFTRSSCCTSHITHFPSHHTLTRYTHHISSHIFILSRHLTHALDTLTVTLHSLWHLWTTTVHTCVSMAATFTLHSLTPVDYSTHLCKHGAHLTLHSLYDYCTHLCKHGIHAGRGVTEGTGHSVVLFHLTGQAMQGLLQRLWVCLAGLWW